MNGEPGVVAVPEHEDRAAFTDRGFADRSGSLPCAAHRYAEQCNGEGEDWACGSSFHRRAIMAGRRTPVPSSGIILFVKRGRRAGKS